MKVCLVAVSSLRVAPYVNKYDELLKKNGIECDIISKEHEEEKDNYIADEKNFVFFYKDAKTIFQKIKRFLQYADFVNDVLVKEKYDRMIIFDAFYAVLYYFKHGINFFKKTPYILDIRDYNPRLSYCFVKKVLKKIMNNAGMVTLSSSKFKIWLPTSSNLFTMHNIPLTDNLKKNTQAFCNQKIKIAYLGGIGYYEQNKKIVVATHNTDVKLMYAGVYPAVNNIKEYCLQNGYDDVLFFGRYNDTEKDKLYADVDIINAVYGNDSLVVTTALPNKLYDSAFYKIPIMVNSGTYLGEIVEKYNMGFTVDPFNDDILACIHSYKENFDSEIFEEGCRTFLRDVLMEQKETENQILKFLGVIYG